MEVSNIAPEFWSLKLKAKYSVCQEASNQKLFIPIVKHGGGGRMIWACFCSQSLAKIGSALVTMVCNVLSIIVPTFSPPPFAPASLARAAWDTVMEKKKLISKRRLLFEFCLCIVKNRCRYILEEFERAKGERHFRARHANAAKNVQLLTPSSFSMRLKEFGGDQFKSPGGN